MLATMETILGRNTLGPSWLLLSSKHPPFHSPVWSNYSPDEDIIPIPVLLYDPLSHKLFQVPSEEASQCSRSRFKPGRGQDLLSVTAAFTSVTKHNFLSYLRGQFDFSSPFPAMRVLWNPHRWHHIHGLADSAGASWALVVRPETNIYWSRHAGTALVAMDTDVMLRETKKQSNELANTVAMYCAEEIFCCHCCLEEDLQGTFKCSKCKYWKNTPKKGQCPSSHLFIQECKLTTTPNKNWEAKKLWKGHKAFLVSIMTWGQKSKWSHSLASLVEKKCQNMTPEKKPHMIPPRSAVSKGNEEI